MPLCYFVSDLHGRPQRLDGLFGAIDSGRPAAVFVGGDILPHALQGDGLDYLRDEFLDRLEALNRTMGDSYPEVFAILGNDDGRAGEKVLLEGESEGLLTYAHGKKSDFGRWPVYGYACVPPTPFMLKDWERYDIDRTVPPGAISPEEGWRSDPRDSGEAMLPTISEDLAGLTGEDDLNNAIFLFHTPPRGTRLDVISPRGGMDGHSPSDTHVGSAAVKDLIEKRQPLVTLHGHIHESPRLTGSWRDRIGRTELFSAAHDGPELSLVVFDPENPAGARRELVQGGR